MSLKDLLKDRLSEEKRSLLPKGFEVIGDIAIINIPEPLYDDRYIIAGALVSHRKDIRSVLRKTNKIRGEKRAGEYELILGTGTETYHRENNCVFAVDVTRTYFSTRMGYERKRIAGLVKDGEDVLVLFSGVGPFLIQIKKNKNVSVTGLDSNPDACVYLRKNLELNNVHADIILADAGSMNNLFKKTYDRIVMPAPYGRDHFLDLAGELLRQDGMIHFYTFKKDFEINHFKKLLEEKGWRIDFHRNCGTAAPRVCRYVFDLKKKL